MWVEPAMKDVAAVKLFPANTHIFLMCEDELRRRMRAVRSAFDAAVKAAASAAATVRTLHAFAVKANPLEAVVRIAKEESFAAETASIGEFHIAEKVYGAGGADRIVFDSPAKTLEELAHALPLPCYLNVDNLVELERIVALSEGRVAGFPKIPVKATLGIRINPQTVVQTKNTALATGGKISKFGVSLHDADHKERIVDAFVKYHDSLNLKMLHVHSGSQGLSLDTMVAGVKAIVEELADDPRIASLVEVVDIGGGFPVDLATDDETVTVRDYVAALQREVPTLFAPAHSRLLITEFGRAICAKAGVLISRVEYVKQSGGRQILLQHIGADLAVRTVWQPEKWPLRVFVYDMDGHRKPGASAEGSALLTDVGGPCCNSGCTIARAADLPTNVKALEDVVVVHDVGGYYHSSFCLYNLRQLPACFMYHEGQGNDARGTLKLIKKKQTVEDTMRLFEADA
ncbi:putative bacterial-type diaminopimelate decarboxylase [Leptomonas pyrrhocoris]|uniref:Putative bacterial-type diaminopimelate decarboxylase n=1 Tax=Leptomonas pyrrhocoris TaxID=157538 RepID=A0A0N0DSR3_LEPPY|nr:putative bacterial-type diaminopimelate decarboxylase [Leptomonas pyrrhocoris]XP_015654420.1 putative bacterial-type diaminopimelate decarboxylase [Leptomonas pyrrhocoris]KPA75980.1 putative bacterial-type diaminopimelate decarboxylase [Leptomonas pyrrhocoris]KPA75981.1 putative bacterial-type diaminopimelate decarboxylase [Leptomonas pyrrhocoris]|eukprot:XP_015654419.1 putative bacterial-type diaminopimelate decarboxylase [Leptomonas pyrrhocoris]